MEKFKGKRIKPNELIKKATFNLNNTRSAKYGYLHTHPNKLKNRHQIQKRENTFKKSTILIG